MLVTAKLLLKEPGAKVFVSLARLLHQPVEVAFLTQPFR